MARRPQTAAPRPRPRIEDDGAADSTPRAPIMSRSRVQLATSYAPGVLFTWEGAKGICRSVPVPADADGVVPATRLLIQSGITEFASNWLARASRIRAGIPIELILDDAFYESRTLEVKPNWNQDFQINDPKVVGYVPFPLLYRCATCGMLREFENLADQRRRRLPSRCGDHRARWTQVDVVYAHWSGRIEPLSPFKYHYDANRGEATRIMQCECGSQDFKLRNQAPVFADWRFVCDGCGGTREVKQPDKLTWEILEREKQQTGQTYEFIEVNMLPVSYRANSAFYPQKGTFIEFSDPEVVNILRPERQGDLLQEVARIHGFAFNAPSDADIQQALAGTEFANDWGDYEDCLQFAERARGRGQQARADELLQKAGELKNKWIAAGVISRGSVQSAALTSATVQRSEWARKYDPIRLTIEHDRFVREHITAGKEHGHRAVDVLQPDRLLTDAYGDEARMRHYREDIGTPLQRMGVAELVLIRGLPVCEFSFGYTRVSAEPVYVREFNNRRVNMPVRLNAFPQMRNGKRPIYVTRQNNEALYFRLDEGRVRRWLGANGIQDITDGKGIGASLLETYQDFGAFLDDFKQREGRGSAQRAIAPYVYLLLHSLAHQVMQSLADVSGLDRDGLGEYVFPADLAFVVYRRGMTPDLGNVSAMWRNHARQFLRRMRDARTLRCGSGSLCDTRGGACPACIMVSEVTCIASNHLLSRAALRGGAAPTWEPSGSAPLVGFFDPVLGAP